MFQHAHMRSYSCNAQETLQSHSEIQGHHVDDPHMG